MSGARSVLTAVEREQILCGFNDTKADYPREQTIHRLFEEQAARTPDRIALRLEERTMTYRELNERANRAARALRAQGAGPEQIVGLLAERSFEMIIGIFSILKTGASYLPIDPDYPQERIAFMLEDSGAQLVLTQPQLADQVPDSLAVLSLEEAELETGDGSDLGLAHDAGQLAYVIYTSGSTGKPKGVMIEHRNVVRLMINDRPLFDFHEQDVWTMFHSFCFDFSVWEMYGALLFGGKLVIVPKRIAQDPRQFVRLLAAERVTVLNQTPASFYNVAREEMERAEADLALRMVIFGGEALNPILLADFKGKYPLTKLINMYGITEITVHATYKEITEQEIQSDVSNIGKPIPTLTLYVLDEQLEPLPIGEAGELCVSGEGVARGYLNRAELTAERFVANPFAKGERMYRSGDLARWLPDGTMEYLGRMDHQVKIRGHRIELGEIEYRLAAHEQVENVTVIAREDQPGDKQLCAYIVSEQTVEPQELRRYLRELMPEYMIPAFFVQVEQIPLTGNGKVDRQALPAPQINVRSRTEYAAPREEREEQLVRIWQEVLGVDGIGVRDTFFELGGHSLKATAAAAKIRREMGADVSIGDLFAHPTVEALAAWLATSGAQMSQPIPAAEEREWHPVSPSQRRMLALQELGDAGTHYNVPLLMRLEGEVDMQRFAEAVQALLARHEALRTSFELRAGEPMQIIHKHVQAEIEFREAKGTERETWAGTLLRPFDLATAPLMRAEVIETGAEEQYLFLDMHHIISDGITLALLVRELADLYAGRELPAVKVQYKDFVAWQEQAQQEDSRQYWQGQFAEDVAPLQIPTDFPRPLRQRFEGKTLPVTADSELVRELRALAAETGTTLYMVLMAAFNILLAKLSRQEDIVVGLPVAGRTHPDLEGTAGLFINTLALRNQPGADKSFRAFLAEVKERSLQAMAHEAYPFDQLVDGLNLRRDASRHPLFDVMFAMQNMQVPDFRTGSLNGGKVFFDPGAARFDLVLYAYETDAELTFEWEYATALFAEQTVERFAGHLLTILRRVLTDPEVKIAEIELATEADRMQILEAFNATATDYPREKSIAQLFEEQAAITPDRVAVVQEGERLTYRELNERANRLARGLRKKGVQAEQVVGIMTEPSLNMAVAALAVLKAGGAYLPIDPVYPADRIEYLLQDSQAAVLLTQADLPAEIGWQGDVIDLRHETFSGEEAGDLCAAARPDQLAYVIYTSGSTGLPKGVMVEHRNVVRLVKEQRYVEMNAGDRLLMTGSFVFDASTFEIWGSLCNGLELHLLDKERLLDTVQLERVLQEHRIDIIWMTAPLFHQMAQEHPALFRSLRTMVVGGDTLSVKHIAEVQAHCPDLCIVNGYGPTENTTFSTTYPIPREIAGSVPIGKPISNSTAYVVEPVSGQLQPVGVVGELWVGGDGVARGYLNRPEMTAEKFIADPFCAGSRLYKTGDLARWLPDGNLEFLGRIDNQVKVRGFRVEVGEIEHQLLQLEGIKEAAVVVREESGQKELCAYYVTEAAHDDLDVREKLAGKMPDYLIPTYFVQIDRLPLTVNGKIDRRALPEPDPGLHRRAEHVAPRDEWEMRVASVWQEVLGLEAVSVKDSFFELGGHSLKATALVAKLRQALQVELSIRDIFEKQTVEKLARWAADSAGVKHDPLELVVRQEHYPVSSAQMRLFLLQEIGENKRLYNIPLAMRMSGPLDKARFAESWQILTERHDALRTSFRLVDGEPVQIIADRVELEIGCTSVSEAEIEETLQRLMRPFDLTRAPLLRVEVLELSEEDRLLLIDVHHIVADGVSLGLMLREFEQLYAGYGLPEARVQYVDFAAWQAERLQSEAMREQEAYWLGRFEEELPVLQLPTDFPRPPMQQFDGRTLTFQAPPELVSGLKKLTAATGTTLYMLLLAAYNVLLSKYSRQEDVVVGSPIAGRTHSDVQDVVGMFVNTLAIRTAPAADLSFREFLLQVKEEVLQAIAHQEYQFEELVDKLRIQRDVARNPVFDVMFSMNNMDLPDIETDGLALRAHRFDYPFAKFDLTLFAEEKGAEIEFALEYSTALFRPETAERIAEHYVQILRSILADPAQKLAGLRMVTAAEEEMLLHGFNDTAAPYAEDKLMHQLFEERAILQHDHPAVEDGRDALTYRELDERANRLAHLLREKGAGEGMYVGVLMKRSVQTVVAVLGVLKAGAAYVPMETSWPMERVQTILSSLQVTALLVDDAQDGALAGLQEQVPSLTDLIGMRESATMLAAYPADKLPDAATPDSLAYAIFTSGSTGTPKGVMVQHRPAINLIEWVNGTFAVNPQDKVLFVTSLCFDLSVYDMFGLLAAGGTVRVASSEEVRDPDQLLSIIANERITFWDSAPAALNQLVPYFGNERRSMASSSLRLVFLSGDWIPVTLPDALKRQFAGVNVISLGGATEATVWSNFYPIDHVDPEWKSIPYGKPIQNARYYILDAHLSPVPVGVPGDLYIGGDCLSAGYVNAPDLTADRFLPDPFVADSKARMYKTGDLARWFADGNMEFLGRVDHQVKVRGYRIELGEIEYHLLHHESVQDALVLVLDDAAGNKYLCAYAVAKETISVAEIRAYLAAKLPDYMVPAVFVMLDEMPVTSNGKVDRKRLPEPERAESAAEHVPPQSETETMLAEIWRSLLPVEQFGVRDNFFDLGGNSLLLVQMHAKIDNWLPGKVKVVDLFAAPTIAQLAERLSGQPAKAEAKASGQKIDDLFDLLEKGEVDAEQALLDLLDLEI